jgi:hypothetical protein
MSKAMDTTGLLKYIEELSELRGTDSSPETVAPAQETLAIAPTIAALAPGTAVLASDLTPGMAPQPYYVGTLAASWPMLFSI